ncbi:MAG: hypothetical protein ACTSRI_00045 [Promethearchaeota archaeon]
MNFIFLIKSASVDINKYTIKNIPGSSGRLDVISRCILAVLLNDNKFEKKIQIWIFLDKYGTFIFDSELLEYENFPKNELLLTDYLVRLIQKKKSKIEFGDNPLRKVKISEMRISEALKKFINSGYNVFILKENGQNFFNVFQKIHSKKDVIFVIGNQRGNFLNSEDLLKLKIPILSLGTRSYLASSIIRLIKLNIL